jgi:hypothetical protein
VTCSCPPGFDPCHHMRHLVSLIIQCINPERIPLHLSISLVRLPRGTAKVKSRRFYSAHGARKPRPPVSLQGLYGRGETVCGVCVCVCVCV